MRRRGLGAGLAVLVVALFVGAAAPAFADDAPTTTTDPSATTPPTTADPAAPSSPSDETPPTDPPTTTDPSTTDPAPVDAPTVAVGPAVTVTPSTGLVHLQTVTISGTGFTPSVSVGWAECKNTNSGDANDCDTTHTGFATSDSSGAFSGSFVVRRILHTPNGDVDCATAPGTCNIGAAKITDYSEHAGAPLTFDPSAPLPPPPTLLAGPLTDLREGDSVALFGDGFVPNGQVAIVQCSQPSVQTCQVLQYLPADGNGGFITLVQVHRFVATPPFGATDCADAPDTCQLRAVSLDDYDFEAHVFLDFDPTGPLPPGQVTVTPDTDLLNFQPVTLNGSGFPASAGVEVVQCKTDATSQADCSRSQGFAPTSTTGTFTLTRSVRRILHLESGDVDCASAPGACSLVSTSFAASAVVVVSPLDFVAGVPPPLPAAISVTPDTGLVQGQSVTVTGEHFPPDSFVSIGECLSDTEHLPYCPIGGPVANTDADGAFTQTFAVRRGVPDFETFPPDVVDCAESSGRCSVVAFSYDGDDSARHAIDFDPSVPIPVPDTNVSPQFDLPDRAVVNVQSTGFTPGERVLVSQCVAGSPTYGDSCTDSGGPLNLLQADGAGVVDTSIRVHREIIPSGGVIIITADGTTNCSDAVGACVLRVQSIDDPLVVSDVDLGFDPTAVAPPPTLTVSPAGPYPDGQQVVVHGAGFTPNAVLGLGQCSSAAPNPGGSSCDSGPDGLFTEFPAEADGTFTRTVTLHTQVQTTDGTLDCRAAGSCVLFAANRNDYGAERVSAPIEFVGPAVAVEGISQTRTLAFTGAGAATMPTAAIGFGVLLVGAALLLLARRRRA